MIDWVTVSALATAGGTLVLAAATFGSVRSANRAARVAEEALLAGIRPLLMPSRQGDAAQKVTWADDHVTLTRGGEGTAEDTDEAVYLTLSLRNAGNGIAVLHGWRVEFSLQLASAERPVLHTFRRLSRDLYVASGDVAFWQGAVRDPADADFAELRTLITARSRIVIDLLYGDHQGGQRVVSRFTLNPRDDTGWFATVVRHWNVDRPAPR